MGARARAALGRRAGRDPGSGLGAELPAPSTARRAARRRGRAHAARAAARAGGRAPPGASTSAAARTCSPGSGRSGSSRSSSRRASREHVFRRSGVVGRAAVPGGARLDEACCARSSLLWRPQRVGVAIGLVLLERDDDGWPPPARAPRAARCGRQATVEPRVALFAEPVTAEAAFLVDPGARRSGHGRASTRLRAVRRRRGTDGRARRRAASRVRFRYRCMRSRCLREDDRSPSASATSSCLRARVVYRSRSAAGAHGRSSTGRRSRSRRGVGPFDARARALARRGRRRCRR